MNVYTQRTNYEFTFIMQEREGELQVTVHSVQIKQNVVGGSIVTIFAFMTSKSCKSSLLLEFESQYKGIWIKRSNREIRFYSFPGIRVSLKMNS